VEVVHHRGAAAQQELAQQRDLALLHPHAARLDEVDPRILKQPGIVERQQDRILHVDRGRRLDPPREVLLRRGRVDAPRIAVEVLGNARAFGREVILDANEAPLQAGVRSSGASAAARLRRQRCQQRGNKATRTGARASAERTCSRPAPVDQLQQQFLRALVGRRDLERGQRLLLRLGRLPALK
jgi:hypothetical protein